tara:strand:- start:52 stop:726 length:675 start_codon:yes stop_codon:yes gene_type:complete
MNKSTNTVNRYYKGNSSGGSMAMKKKHANKFNKISNGKFSINSSVKQYYIGNQSYANNNYTDCKTTSNDILPITSVKSQFALMTTRLKGNNTMNCNPVISLKCSKELIDPTKTSIPDNSFNEKYTKIIRTNHQDYSHYLENRISECNISKNTNIETNALSCISQKSKNTTTIGHIKNLTRTCQITKDIKGSFVNQDYSDYLLTLKNKSNCYNPKNVNTKICRIY